MTHRAPLGDCHSSSEVRTADDLPSRLLLGDLDRERFRADPSGWAVRYRDADPETYVDLRFDANAALVQQQVDYVEGHWPELPTDPEALARRSRALDGCAVCSIGARSALRWTAASPASGFEREPRRPPVAPAATCRGPGVQVATGRAGQHRAHGPAAAPACRQQLPEVTSA